MIYSGQCGRGHFTRYFLLVQAIALTEQVRADVSVAVIFYAFNTDKYRSNVAESGQARRNPCSGQKYKLLDPGGSAGRRIGSGHFGLDRTTPLGRWESTGLLRPTCPVTRFRLDAEPEATSRLVRFRCCKAHSLIAGSATCPVSTN
ncbi:hypothetical protein J6590_009467 [Homalodisca vitripennis]|nr:hypothetical protein J6590_009467 [Homalodisca vitripennis]